jgi:hypothetical protein
MVTYCDDCPDPLACAESCVILDAEDVPIDDQPDDDEEWQLIVLRPDFEDDSDD